MRRSLIGCVLGFSLACGFGEPAPSVPIVVPESVVKPEPVLDLDSDPTLFPEIATMSVEQLEQELEAIKKDRAETTKMIDAMTANMGQAMAEEDESAPLVERIADLEKTLDQTVQVMDVVIARIRKRRARKRALMRRLEQLRCENGAPCKVTK